MGLLFETKGLDEVLAGIEGASAELGEELRRIGGARARRVIVEALSDYPAPSGKKMGWKSEKQRRFVMAAIRKGQIEVPYRRTERLKRGWERAHPIYTAAGGMQLVNPIPYSDWVQGEHQARYHEGTWEKMKDIARAIEPDVQEAYQEGIEAWLKQLAS